MKADYGRPIPRKLNINSTWMTFFSYFTNWQKKQRLHIKLYSSLLEGLIDCMFRK